MTNRVGVQVEGARRLRRTLRAAGHDLDDLRDANRRAAGIAAGASAPLAPFLTGRLRRSVRSSGTMTAGIIRAGRKSVPYAAPIHWGWPSRGIKSTPFLTLGAQSSEPVWLPLYETDMHTAIARVKGK